MADQADVKDAARAHRSETKDVEEGDFEGECFLEACAHRGQVYLRQVPADEIFPVGHVQPDGQYGAYVRRKVRNAGTDDAPPFRRFGMSLSVRTFGVTSSPSLPSPRVAPVTS